MANQKSGNKAARSCEKILREIMCLVADTMAARETLTDLKKWGA
jgi:hypothetical protein